MEDSISRKQVELDLYRGQAVKQRHELFPSKCANKQEKTAKAFTLTVLVGEGGFEPPKALPADLQSVPFGHSGNPPNIWVFNWSWWTDSNPRPADYKSAALPAELHQRLTSEDYITRLHPVCQQKFSPPAGIFYINRHRHHIHPCTQERGGS